MIEMMGSRVRDDVQRDEDTQSVPRHRVSQITIHAGSPICTEYCTSEVDASIGHRQPEKGSTRLFPSESAQIARVRARAARLAGDDASIMTRFHGQQPRP